MSQSEDQLYKNLTEWFVELDGIVLHLHSQKEVFWKVMEIISSNPKLSEQGNHFFEYMKGWYESHIVMAIRRLIDHRREARSYLQFLQRIKRDHLVITRERYKNLYANGWFLESQADNCFDSVVGEGNNHLNINDVEADIRRLTASAKIIKDYVDVRVAHFNPNQPEPSINHTHIDATLQTIGELHKKYHNIFKGSSLFTTTPTILYDWEEIFYIPWIKSVG